MTELGSRVRRVRWRDDSGVTLVEMLIVITVVSIITVPLTAAVIITLRTTGAASLRLTQSHDRQLLEVYFPRDVASATSTPQVDVNGTCAGKTSKVVLKWTGVPAVSGVPATTVQQNYEADYVVEGANLVRYLCQGGAKSSFAVAYALSSTTPPSAVVSGKSVTLTVTDSSGASYSVAGQGRT